MHEYCVIEGAPAELSMQGNRAIVSPDGAPVWPDTRRGSRWSLLAL